MLPFTGNQEIPLVVMAAHGNNFIRVRLMFDYPPPALVDCRMCWLLVDLNTCRVVADLESIIREKFDFSRRSILNLFIDSFYLPHTESVYVVRDNDSVRWGSLLTSLYLYELNFLVKVLDMWATLYPFQSTINKVSIATNIPR